MRRALVIYNRAAGRNRARRAALVESILRILQGARVEASAVESRGPRRAAEQSRGAIEGGFDAIIACGGDGTVHDVLQGMVNTEAALGVIPTGTGNILARNLGLPLDPAAAARALLTAEPRRVALGKIEYSDGKLTSENYFSVAAGIGMDALLMYKLAASRKEQLGMMAYYAMGLRLSLMHSLPWFEVEFTDASGTHRRECVAQLLASRVSDYGDIVRRVTPDASLESEDFQLVLFKSRSRSLLWRYLVSTYTRSGKNFPAIELVQASGVSCRVVPQNENRKIYAEADGEALGGLPVHIRIVPSALKLLFPRSVKNSEAMRGS